MALVLTDLPNYMSLKKVPLVLPRIPPSYQVHDFQKSVLPKEIPESPESITQPALAPGSSMFSNPYLHICPFYFLPPLAMLIPLP